MKRSVGRLLVVLLPVAMVLVACGTTADTAPDAVAVTAMAVEAMPTDGVTRAAFVGALTNYFGWPHRDDYNDYWEDLTPPKAFNDVRKSDQYGRQIEAAYDEGIIAADASGNFNPNELITREDAALIFANAWKLAESGSASSFADAGDLRRDARGSVGALVDLGIMTGRTTTMFAPKDYLTVAEFKDTFEALKNTVVTPVYALPRQGYDAPRRYVMLYTATPGATIYFTNDGSQPSEDGYVYEEEYIRPGTGHIMEMLGTRGGEDGSPPPTERNVVYKAFSAKDGLVPSDVQTFTWHLYRPQAADASFESIKVVNGSATVPTVYEVYNDSESVRAMAWYIEGPKMGIVYDALQTPVAVDNLKDYIDSIATKPYICVLGHEHGDHDAQIPAFIQAGIDVYANERGWAAIGSPGGFGAVVTTPELQSKVMNVDEGDSFDLGGGIVFEVYAMPGHANGNIVLNDKQSGMVFASDIYGCTRAGSADNVGVSGLPADLLLSFAQQVHAEYLDGGEVTMLFTGHDEYPLTESILDLFEAALQKVVDNGEAGCTPTLRTNNASNSRTTMIGDMWKDNTDWISLMIGGVLGDDYEYLTNNEYMNYNDARGFMKYSVLSNVEIDGGRLVGTTVGWADSRTFEWNGSRITVPNSVPDRFDPWTFDYTIEVPSGTSSIVFCPVTMSTKVTSLKLNGREVDYRSENMVIVADGTLITVDIVAPDGKTQSTYTFIVHEV